MDIHSALDWRYAVREFSSDRLTTSQLHSLMDATRKSASSYGLQPYKLIVLESQEIRQKLLPHSFGQDKVVNSSHLIVFAAQREIGYWTVDRYIQQLLKLRGGSYDSLNDYARHMKQSLASKTAAEKREWAHQQTYIALGTFLTAAAMMKIDTCPMTGINHKAYDEVLGLKTHGLETSVIAAVGYRSPDDKSATHTKIRFDYDDFVLSY